MYRDGKPFSFTANERKKAVIERIEPSEVGADMIVGSLIKNPGGGLAPCIGCNSCFDRAGHECFQQDDMQVVYDKLKCADVIVVASPVYFYGVSAQLKAIIDRLHTPMRNDFKVKKLALILVGAAVMPELFDSIKIQYQLVLNFFKLEDAGMVLVRGAKDKGDVRNTDGLDEAYRLGLAME